METEIDQLRKQREYYTRRLNVLCSLTPPQHAAAVSFVSSSLSLGLPEAEAYLARQRFVWEGMESGDGRDAVTAALGWKHRLLDEIEKAGPLPNPCHECYQKSPEARAEKRKHGAILVAASAPSDKSDAPPVELLKSIKKKAKTLTSTNTEPLAPPAVV